MTEPPHISRCKVAFIGAGNMATALIKGVVSLRLLDPSNISASSPSGPGDGVKELGIRATRENADCARGADIIILAVKPVYVETALRSIADDMSSEALLVSIVAGVPISKIQTVYLDCLQILGDNADGKPRRVVRVMPNTPCAIAQGVSAMAPGLAATKADLSLVSQLFSAVGIVEQVTESQLDAVTGLTGSGPAYVLMMIESLADGGVAAGLPRAVARRFAVQLVKGTAAMAEMSGKHTAELKDSVASPAGTTIAGILALEKGGFRGTVMQAVMDATARSVELGKLY